MGMGEYERSLYEAQLQRRKRLFPGAGTPVGRIRHGGGIRPVHAEQAVVFVEIGTEPIRSTASVAFVVPPPEGTEIPDAIPVGYHYPVLEYSLEPYRPRRPARDIIQDTALEFGVTFAAIIGPNRSVPLVLARHTAIWRVCCMYPDMSLPQVGRLFGKRDHSSIHHAIRAADMKMRAQGFATFADEVARWGGHDAVAARMMWDRETHSARLWAAKKVRDAIEVKRKRSTRPVDIVDKSAS